MSREEEEARLDQAMRRADELLVDSLKRDDRRLRFRTVTTLSVMLIAGVIIATIALTRGKRDDAGIVTQRPSQATAQATAQPGSPPASSRAFAAALTSLKDDNWRRAFTTGQQLAALPPEYGWPILEGNWSKIPNFEARQQIIKAFVFRGHSGEHHPRVLDVLHLGMTDPQPQVRAWAGLYLRGFAFEDFAEDSSGYERWRARTAGRPVADVVAEGAAAWAARVTTAADAESIKKHAALVRDVRNDLARIRPARDAAVRAGALDAAVTWIRNHPDDRDILEPARDLLTGLKPDEAYLRRAILPLLDAKHPAAVRRAATDVLGRPDNKWAVDPLVAVLRESVTAPKRPDRDLIWGAATALGEIGDPRAIPDMIAAIAHDNTYDTVYGVGYFGLASMTGVKYDAAHDGAWWQQWWERERQRFPEPARSTPIPTLPKTRAASSDAATARPILAMMLADDPPPVQDLRAGNHEQMRYLLNGPRTKALPADGYKLLLVLPGGDGGADFRDFVTDIANSAVSADYLVAQLVAPRWSDAENRVVWPTEKSRDPKMKFATEKFIDTVVADVAKKHKLDAKHVYALGWSSGGPPVYAAAMRPKSPLSGAFVAMSVYKPDQLPPPAGAKGRAFYILHSPQDFIRMTFPQNAQKQLKAAGATTRLVTYEGGHGWQGDPIEMVKTGIEWLEKPE